MYHTLGRDGPENRTSGHAHRHAFRATINVGGTGTKDEKFERRAAKAAGDSERTERLYMDLLCEKPSYKRDSRLESLEEDMDPALVENILICRYHEMARRNAEIRYEQLTGYGQCRGELVTVGNDVVVCCCEPMASLVAFGRAHVVEGSIRVAPEGSPVSKTEEGTYIVREKGRILRRCPFCGAPVSEAAPAPEPEAQRQQTSQEPAARLRVSFITCITSIT